MTVPASAVVSGTGRRLALQRDLFRPQRDGHRHAFGAGDAVADEVLHVGAADDHVIGRVLDQRAVDQVDVADEVGDEARVGVS